MKRHLIALLLIALTTAVGHAQKELEQGFDALSTMRLGDSNAELARKFKMANPKADEAKVKNDLDRLDNLFERQRKYDRIDGLMASQPRRPNRLQGNASPRSKVRYPSRPQGGGQPQQWVIERDKQRTQQARESANANRAAARKGFEHAQKNISDGAAYQPRDLESMMPVRGNQVNGEGLDQPTAHAGIDVDPLTGTELIGDEGAEQDDKATRLEDLKNRYIEYRKADGDPLSDDELTELLQLMEEQNSQQS